MTDINNTFFELIQVALGVRTCLSRTPNDTEWKALYDMAKKQSLVGICFAGVQRLQTQRQEPPEMLYLTWMGMAAKIQQRNEVVNRQCVELQAKLAGDGLESAILKGQGVASLYSEHLRGLRQSGDIDVYVPCGMEKALAYVNGKYGKCEYDYINAHVPVYQDTEVELHWSVKNLNNIFLNSKLQRWFKDNTESILGGKATLSNGEMVVTPSVEFNLFYILLHIYEHEFSEGVGLRQLMDYYFVLIPNERNAEKDGNVRNLYKRFGMMKFAAGVMWILHYVFGMDSKYDICEPNEQEGRFLLDEIMEGGNFGHHDSRIKQIGRGKMQFLFGNMQHNWHLATHYPLEFFWAPVWLVYHWWWKRFGKH